MFSGLAAADIWAGQETGHRSGTLKQEPHESACGMGGDIGEIKRQRKASGR
jgi:hypothetical protein